MPLAKLLCHRKRIINEDIIEIKIWKIRKSNYFPESIKYSMVYLKKKNGHYERIFGYDNERGKGHHEHRNGKEKSIEFRGWEHLVRQFYKEVEKIRKGG